MAYTSKVSIVMPAYNGEAYLKDAIESILSQSLEDWQLIVINDGSTDNTKAVLDRYTDKRIIVKHRGHDGLVASLNLGLSLATGKYLARMDCDDIAYGERLQQQASFLDSNPNVGILGSACEQIDAAGRKTGLVEFPLDDMNIRWTSLLNNPFAHPSVMARREILEKHSLVYEHGFEAVEDYELWTRVLEHTEGANLRQPLLRYRRHGRAICGSNTEIQMTNHDRVAYRTICRQLPEVTIPIETVGQLRRLFVQRSKLVQREERIALSQSYLSLLSAFEKRQSDRRAVRRLRHYEALKVARLGLLPAFRMCLTLMRQLLILNPIILGYLVLFGPRAIGKALVKGSDSRN